MTKKYQDGIQGTIEAGLLNAFGSDPTFRARVNDEQLTGATMLRHNIFYNEAKERVQQALKNIHGTTPEIDAYMASELHKQCYAGGGK